MANFASLPEDLLRGSEKMLNYSDGETARFDAGSDDMSI
jgi:hypothetical protein